MRPYQRELLQDASLLCTVLFNWLGAAAIADAFSPTLNAKRAVSVYVATIAVAVNGYSLARSASFLGKGEAPKESIPGLFAEIVNLTQVWGTLFAVCALLQPARRTTPSYARSLLRVVAESPSSRCPSSRPGSAGPRRRPSRLLERLVAWMAAYLGGVLCTNLFLVCSRPRAPGVLGPAGGTDAQDARDGRDARVDGCARSADGLPEVNERNSPLPPPIPPPKKIAGAHRSGAHRPGLALCNWWDA